MEPIFQNDAIVLGILLIVLAFIFYTSDSKSPFWQKFYTYVPALVLCYFIPSLLNSVGLISGDDSNLYFVASRYLLPTSLIMLTLGTDFNGIMKLGPKALIMFGAATAGIVLGGPVAVFAAAKIAPGILEKAGDEEIWRGLTTVAGSWIGGGANQAAMKEIFHVSDKMFSAMIMVDVVMANVWLAFLLYGAGMAKTLDAKLKSDTSAIDRLKSRIEAFRRGVDKIPETTNIFILVAVGFGATALAHWGADTIAPYIESNYPDLDTFSLTSKFFWLIVISTTLGLFLSFSKARKLEGVGASRMGTLFLYVLVATIGMKMNIWAIVENPGLFLIGFIWMSVHIIVLIVVAKLIKAPFFFVAVGSQANIGGAASAPIVASAFHPSLAPVGVLLAVMGYTLGTYGAWLCGVFMKLASP